MISHYKLIAESIQQDEDSFFDTYAKEHQLNADTMDWDTWFRLCKSLDERGEKFTRHFVPITVKSSMQKSIYKVGKDYKTYFEVVCWGNREKPVLLCCGGILNCARRFQRLASSLKDDFFVISISWVGRGESGFLLEQSDYNLHIYAAHIKETIDYFHIDKCWILGSSLGASAAMCFYKNHPSYVLGFILNDTGPFIPFERRSRRAIAVGRHYVFLTPKEFFRKYSIAMQNKGSMSETSLILYGYWQTEFSSREQGVVYNYDLRALLAYREEALKNVNQWSIWERMNVPILVIHGNLSDALSFDICKEMQKNIHCQFLHVRDVGHTPPLTDANIIGHVGSWLHAQDSLLKEQEIDVAIENHKKLFIYTKNTKQNYAKSTTPLVKEFFLIRHGETYYNRQKKRSGQEYDGAMTAKGKKQIEKKSFFYTKRSRREKFRKTERHTLR